MVPLSLGPLNRAAVGNLPPLGYLPSLEIRRPHKPFRTVNIEELRFGNPRWVFIGDSMLGTRIDPFHLGRISTRGDEAVGFLYHAATGPAWWYLALKNQLIVSGVKPRMTFIFFRDTNLTDTMFRLEGQYGRALDEVAADSEPELDQLVAVHRKGGWYRVHRALDNVYQADLATSWMEPRLRRWWVRWRDPRQEAVESFEWNLDKTFSVDAIRYDAGADLAQSDVTDVPDFHRDLAGIGPAADRRSVEAPRRAGVLRPRAAAADRQPPARTVAGAAALRGRHEGMGRRERRALPRRHRRSRDDARPVRGRRSRR